MDNRELESRLAVHMAQHRLAVMAQWLAGTLGALAAMWHGKITLCLLGAAGVWLFHLAKPGPDSTITAALDTRDKGAGT